jgi:hypothetical protein
MESGVLLRLFAVAPLVAAPVVLLVVARVVIVIVDGDDTHLWALGWSITFIDGSGVQGSGRTHLRVM